MRRTERDFPTVRQRFRCDQRLLRLRGEKSFYKKHAAHHLSVQNAGHRADSGEISEYSRQGSNIRLQGLANGDW